MVRIYSGPDATHQAIVLLVNSWQDRAGSSLPPGSVWTAFASRAWGSNRARYLKALRPRAVTPLKRRPVVLFPNIH